MPRTGIDFPFLKKRPHFLFNCPEYEHINFSSSSPQRILGNSPLVGKSESFNKLVYDCTYSGNSHENKGKASFMFQKENE